MRPGQKNSNHALTPLHCIMRPATSELHEKIPSIKYIEKAAQRSHAVRRKAQGSTPSSHASTAIPAISSPPFSRNLKYYIIKETRN